MESIDDVYQAIDRGVFSRIRIDIDVDSQKIYARRYQLSRSTDAGPGHGMESSRERLIDQFAHETAAEIVYLHLDRGWCWPRA